MFFRADNLKQKIAVAAILLSLSTLAQNSGLYCALGACETGRVAIAAESGACCHDHGCQSDKQQPAPQGDQSKHRHDSCPCPCPDSCWCHQAPQPFELPKSFDEPFELAFLDVFAICNALVPGGLSDQWASVTWSVPPDVDEESVVHRCAKLCRFLI